GRGPVGNGTVGHLDARALRLRLAGSANRLVLADQGVAPGRTELAPTAFREHPDEVDVPTVGLDHAEVGQAVVEAVDAAGRRAADAVAVDRVQALHAQVQLHLGVDGLDGPLDLMPVV